MAAADITSHAVTSCSPQDGVREVMAKLTHRRVRHVPVLEGDELAGIVSIGDIVKHRLEEAELEATVLRDAYIAIH